MNKSMIISVAALILTACGEAATNEPESQADTPATSAETTTPEATPKAAKSDTPPPQPETDYDREFSGKTYTLDQAMSTEVMGLRIGMTPEDVISTLEGRGFTPYGYAKPEEIPQLVADTEFNCKRGDEQRCAPGAMQQNNVLWLRPDPDNELKNETVLVVFYLDAEKNPRAYQITYKQNTNYSELISPKALDAMADRFGEPSYAHKSEQQDGSVRGELNYYLQMPIPKGYTPTKTDIRSYSETITSPRSIVWSRLGCLTKQYAEKLDDLPNGCEEVMNGDANSQRLYDSLREEGHGREVTEFLHITASGSSLEVNMRMIMFPLALKLAQEEAKVGNWIADQKAQRNKGYDAPSDL
jgi:hypothetical protein